MNEKDLTKFDPEIAKLLEKEKTRQFEQLEMIPSENYASKAVLETLGSVLTNKYSEGFAGKRYYQGNEFVDEIEKIAIERAKALFGVPFANVQSYSGSPANAAVYFALLERDDKIMGLSLSFGGHLTHGHPKITFSGKYFKSVQYLVGKDGLIDYDALEELAEKERPKIIISGATAYPRIIDFERFGQIADKIGAWHLSDISHIAGLVVGGGHPSPSNSAHIIMTTTHKTLRGPRGAILLVTEKGVQKDPELPEKINRAVFPGLQGGPHNNVTAAIAVCFQEAETFEFRQYCERIVANAKVLASELKGFDFELTSGGTDNHLLLIDIRNKGIDGWIAAWALEAAGIIVNRNSIPYDPLPPFYPSGIRLGTPAITSRGMKEEEMKKIASWMNQVCEISKKFVPQNLFSLEKEEATLVRRKFKKEIMANVEIERIAAEVKSFCQNFPVPGINT